MSTIDTTTSEQTWTMEITPRNDLLHIPIGDVWKYRDLLWLFVRRDFVAFYKQTILGPLWFFIQPLFTTLIFTLVFGRVGNFAPTGVPTVLFYLCSVTFWNYFAECLNKTATTFKDNANLFGKVYFPRIIVPLSIVISNLIKFAVQFALFLAFYAWYYYSPGEVTVDGVTTQLSVSPNWNTLLLFPVVVLIMGVLGLGLGMLFSAMTTKYRDLVFLLQFCVQLLMYASAVIFSWSKLQSEYPDAAPWLGWNPLISLIETVRNGFLGVESDQVGILYPATVAIVVFAVACVVFTRVEKTFMDTV